MLFAEREAFIWIQKCISQFGGDLTKVTMYAVSFTFHTMLTYVTYYSWGESAGAISVALHLLANGDNPGGLLRGVFMESGAPIPVGDTTNGQKYHDAIVQETGCSSASDSLARLRTVPLSTLKTAINNSPGNFSFQVCSRRHL